MGEETKNEYSEDENSQKRSQNREEHYGIVQLLTELESPLRL